MKFINTFLIPALALASASAATGQPNQINGDLIVFNDNGAWSWFGDERAIVDAATGQILVSSVADASGTGGTGGNARNGDVEITSYNLGNGQSARSTLADNFEADDHNPAALYLRSDGRYLAVYSKHGSDNLTRYRISANPGDASAWQAEQTFDNNAGTTYSNVYNLSQDNAGQGRLYNFTRSVNWNPNLLVSDDQGSTWSYGGRLLTENSERPYVRYTADDSRIHLTTTSGHPRDVQNGIYHGYVQDGKLYNSAGNVVDANLFDTSAVAPDQLTTVFSNGTQFNGTTMNRAWTVDNAVDAAGNPVTVFTARANDDANDHRFFYGKFDGNQWQVHELAKAGGFLYGAEQDYTGLAAIDPNDPDTLYLSSTVDPRNGEATDHYEIYKGVTGDDGANWLWSAITEDSTVDNIRPVVPEWDDQNTALLWLRGDYSTYVDYDLDVVGIVTQVPEPSSGLLLLLSAAALASRRR